MFRLELPDGAIDKRPPDPLTVRSSVPLATVRDEIAAGKAPEQFLLVVGRPEPAAGEPT